MDIFTQQQHQYESTNALQSNEREDRTIWIKDGIT